MLTLVARTYSPRSLLREGKPQSRCCLCLPVCPAKVSELPWAWRGKSSRPVPPQNMRGSSGPVGTGPGHTWSCPPSPLGASPLMRGDPWRPSLLEALEWGECRVGKARAVHILLQEGGLPGGDHDLGDPGLGVTLTCDDPDLEVTLT